MANAAYRSSSTVANAAGTVTVTKPTGTTDGDLLTAFQATALGGGTTPATPAGWTLVDSQTFGTGKLLQRFEKLASSEPASWTFNQPGGSPVGNEVSVYCIATSPGASASEGGTKGTGTGTTADAAQYTTLAANDLLLVCWVMNPGITNTIVPDASFTDLGEIGSLAGLRTDVGYKSQAAAGGTANTTATLGESQPWAAMIVAIAPGAGGGGATGATPGGGSGASAPLPNPFASRTASRRTGSRR